MVEYIVVIEPEIEGLVKTVNQKIRDGFEPIGGIVSDIENHGDVSEIYTCSQYLQSMIKK